MTVTEPTSLTTRPINLQLGWPSPSLFPASALTQATAAALSTEISIAESLVYGPDPGHQALRQNIASFLSDFYQPEAGDISDDRIFVTHGASGALAMILSRFTDPTYTQRIWMVEPTYFLSCPTFQDAGFHGRLRGVPEDHEGIDISFLRRNILEAEERSTSTDNYTNPLGKPKVFRHVIYAVPTFSNPSAKVMSLRRRRELVELAREFDALVITDDVYDFLRWSADENVSSSDRLPTPPPRLVDIDRLMEGGTLWGNTVSNGSFSKILAPGMRSGWVEGTSEMVNDLCNCGPVKSGGSQGHFSATVINQMLSSGAVQKHIHSKLIPTYQRRYQSMIRYVKEYIEPLGITIDGGKQYESTQAKADRNSHCDHEAAIVGGFFMYLRFPDSLPPVVEIARHAMERYDLRIAYGMMGAILGDADSQTRAQNTFGRCARLCWAWHTEEEIEEGIKRLAMVIMDLRAP